MKHRALALLAAACALFVVRDLRAFGLFDSAIFRGGNIRALQEMPTIVVGSTVSYQGRANSAKISYQENGLYATNVRCAATVLTDNQKTIKVAADPVFGMNAQDPTAKMVHFHQDTICSQLQAAAEEGWHLSFTGRVSAMAGAEPSDVSISQLEVTAEAPALGGPSALPDAYSCPVGVCETSGVVASVTASLSREDALCQATLKIQPPNASPQVATVVIRAFPSKSLMECGSSIEAMALPALHAKSAQCAALIDAMARGETVTIDGAVNGSTIYAYSLERKPAAE